MCFFRKKKAADKVKEDRELIETNSKAIDALIILAKDNTEVISGLRELQKQIKYLIPSENHKVMDYDRAIGNKIGDLRIVLTKADGEINKKVENLLTEIKLAIADRNMRV